MREPTETGVAIPRTLAASTDVEVPKPVHCDAQRDGPGDAEEWQDSGGVAGVAPQRGGDVAMALPPQDADGEVAQAGHYAAGGADARLGAAGTG